MLHAAGLHLHLVQAWHQSVICASQVICCDVMSLCVECDVFHPEAFCVLAHLLLLSCSWVARDSPVYAQQLNWCMPDDFLPLPLSRWLMLQASRSIQLLLSNFVSDIGKAVSLCAQIIVLLPLFLFCWYMYKWERQELVPIRPMEGEELPCNVSGPRMLREADFVTTLKKTIPLEAPDGNN